MGAAFMVLSAGLIQVAGGMIEMHFSIFVLLAFLLIYRDWRPIVLAAAVIAVHHLGFALAQAQGLGLRVFPDTSGLGTAQLYGLVLIHALFVVAETAVLVLLAQRLRREAARIGLAVETVAEIAQRIGHGEFADDPRLAHAEPGSIAHALRSMQEALRERIEAERAAAAENVRVRSALDVATAGMMIADAEGRIVYANPKRAPHPERWRAAPCASGFQTSAPAISLAPTSTVFHRDPSHQRALVRPHSRKPTSRDCRLVACTSTLPPPRFSMPTAPVWARPWSGRIALPTPSSATSCAMWRRRRRPASSQSGCR
ncbi:MAG: hypothetical protein KatS3mg128_0244 [Silanimonas sp.]|nr:MAG: hypothetical protein KatS3mg128_0244 [Silanimonas sp.]